MASGADGLDPATAALAGTSWLPAETASFIGRERELSELARELGNARLLTLTGVGGTGKTRLALQLARGRSAQGSEAVVIVSLAGISDSSGVALAISDAFGIRGTSKESALVALVAAVSARRYLLLLDNCEHVLGAAARVVETLLAGCPRLRVLATSRESLRVSGEVTRRVAPLGPPSARESLEDLAHNACVRLFVDRARSRRPDLHVTPNNAGAIATICRQLDGLPLAIELAAGQLGVLSPGEIAARLRNSNDLLSRGSRTTERQETVQATLDWSYDLLSEAQRRAFRRLSVFATSFALEDAGFVIDQTGDGLQPLTDLVEKSLVEPVVDTAGEIRYRLLQPVRQYARNRLAIAGELESAERRFAEGVLRLSAQAEPYLMSGKRAAWMQRLTTDEDNIRAALEWSGTATRSQDVDIGIGTAGNLVFFWSLRGQASEGLEWTEMLLPRGTEADNRSRAKALYASAEMAFVTGRTELARRRIDECVAMWRRIGDKRGLAYALQGLPMSTGHPNSREAVQESLRLFSEIGDEWGAAFATGAVDLYSLLRGGDRDGTSKRRLEDAVVTFRRLGDDWAAGQMLNILGDAARIEQDDATAERCYAESLRLLRASGIRGPEASLLQNLGYLRLRAGDNQQARRMFAPALEIFRGQGDRRGEADCLDGL
ncbi:MAG TPA: tetratricopeptide repeat protein, partial [Chloroflexota bacterium]|nr:tetratricopeptide repeat protein [Chloroflexota bacterium]